MEKQPRPKPQAILDNWKQVGERLYGHPLGHPDYKDDVTLGIRPLSPPELPEPGVVVETQTMEWRLGMAAKVGPKAIMPLLEIPYG